MNFIRTALLWLRVIRVKRNRKVLNLYNPLTYLVLLLGAILVFFAEGCKHAYEFIVESINLNDYASADLRKKRNFTQGRKRF